MSGAVGSVERAGDESERKRWRPSGVRGALGLMPLTCAGPPAGGSAARGRWLSMEGLSAGFDATSLTGVIHPVYSGCMTPTQYKTLGHQAAALIDDYAPEPMVIFGRETPFTQEEKDRLIGEEMRRLVALHREVAGS